MGNPDSLTSASGSKSYATIDTDKDLATEFGGPCRAIRVGEAGDLALEYADGTTDTIPALLAGETILVQAVTILTAGTTAAKVTAFR